MCRLIGAECRPEQRLAGGGEGGAGRGGENREMMMKSILDIPRGPLEIQTNLREQFTITEKALTYLQSPI